MASGMALTMAPATESIMGSLPLAKAGVGSAVNDTTRQVGGALGVAVVGSVLASIYGSKVGDFLVGKPVPSGVAESMKQSLGRRARRGPRTSPGLAEVAKNAFVDGMHAGVLVAAACRARRCDRRLPLAAGRGPATTPSAEDSRGRPDERARRHRDPRPAVTGAKRRSPRWSELAG